MAEQTKEKPGPAAAPTGETPTPRAARPDNGQKKQPETRNAEMPVGIAGFELQQQERQIGADEPPPLPVNAELKAIGKPTPRIDGRLKVTGAAKYTADVKLPGMLYGVMITSPHPHARITRIDISQAQQYPGVKAIHVLEKLFGVAEEKGEEKERYPLIRFAGQPIAGLAATSQAAADEAARLIRIDYEEMPFVVDVDKAREPDAPVVFAGQAEQKGTAGGGGGPSGVPQKGNVRGPVKGGT